jgi:hypothetical protein
MTVVIDMDKRCDECGKGGALESGICIRCASKALKPKPMKSARGRMVQARYQKLRAMIR